MLKVVFAVLAVLLASLVLPETSWAWGPCVHLHTGAHILANLHLLDPVIAELLETYRSIFLYGTLSPDIFIGKGSRFTPSHCHNWSTGYRMLAAVDQPELLAFTYGYLCHLAADTVAHNFYVPNMLSMSGGRSKLRHVYIEMLADRRLESHTDQARELLRVPYTAANSFMRKVMEKKRFSFSVKREIFRRTINLFNLKTWQQSMTILDKAVDMPCDEAYLDRMISLSTGMCVDFIQDPLGSVALKYDPIGSRNLRLVGRKLPAGREGQLLFPEDASLAEVVHF